MIDKLVPREFKSDQDERLTPPTAFIDALNITVDTDSAGNAGVVKNIKGTSAVIDSTSINYSGETIEVIGTCRDNERGRTYIFVYCGTSSKNAILQYEDERNELTVVFSHSALNFSSNSWVSSSVVNGDFRGDGNRSILYFTDNINEPRKIDIDAISEFAGLTTGQITKKLSVMKAIGVDCPKVFLSYDPDIGFSNFGRSSYQFATQFIYKDGEISALSPYSRYVYAEQRHDEEVTASRLPNVCSITLPYYSVDEDVKRVRVLFRENNGTEVSPFRIIEEFDPRVSISRNIGDLASYQIFQANGNVYKFINDGYAGVLPSFQEDNPFSAVPKRAKTQSVINSRIVYGNYLDGFQNLGDEDGVDGFSGEKPSVTFRVDYTREPTDSETEHYGPVNSSTGSDIVGSSATDLLTFSGGSNVVTANENDGPNIYMWNNVSSTYASPNTFSFKFVMPYAKTFHLFNVGTASNKFLSVTVDDGGDVDINIDAYDDLRLFDVSVFANYEITQATAIADILTELNYQLGEQKWTQVFLDKSVTVSSQEYKISGEYTVTPKLFLAQTTKLYLRFIVSSVHATAVKKITGAGALDFEALFIESQSSGLGVGGTYVESWGVSQTASGWPSENRAFVVGSIPVSSGFTGGSNHSFAVSYIDKYGRYGSAQEIGSVYVHPVGSSERYISSSWYNGPAAVKINLTHEPPDWAERYALLYAGPDDVDQIHDLYVDDATKVIQETKNFKGVKPTSVFVNISSYVENLRRDNLEFSSMYVPEPGDIFRVISKRDYTISGSYVAGYDYNNPPSNLHTLSTSSTYWKDFTGDLALGSAGDTVDFPVISVFEISENTAEADYPFMLDFTGEVRSGFFVELDIDPNNAAWGSKSMKTIREHILQNTADPYPNYANTITSGDGYRPENDYDNTAVNHNVAWKEFFTDGDYSNYNKKPLYRNSAWDKGVRAQIIKPKKRTSARVYHEIGVFERMTDRTGSGNIHGTPVITSDGYSWYRKIHSKDRFGEIERNTIIPYTIDITGAWSGSDYYDAGSSPYTAITRRDELEIYDGYRVAPYVDNTNYICETFYTFPDSTEQIRNIGRLNVVSREGEKRRFSSLIHSQPYNSESLHLTLQDFVATDFKDMDFNHGAINATTPTDQYLTVLQSSKVSKVPVSRDIITTAAGGTSVSLTNAVLGAEMAFAGDYGVPTNGSAVINVDGTVYFIDKSRRAIVKISQAGFAPINTIDISEKIEQTFKDSESSSKNYAIGFDRERSYVYFTFQEDSPFNGETYGYDHIKGAWTSRYNLKPLAYARCENDMLSFNYTASGICHRHDNDTQRCNFYGTQQKSHVTLVSTAKDPSAVKVYNAIGLECNAHESADAKPNVAISNSVDQSVTISWNQFSEKEGRLYKEIPSDGSNLQQAQKTNDLTVTTTVWSGHVVPLGVVDSLDSDRFNLKSKVSFPIPKNQNVSLVWFNGTKWVSILSPHILGTTTNITDGFVDGSKITGSGVSDGKTYIEASGFFGTYDSYIPANGTPVGSMLAYIVTDPTDVFDTTYSGTEINQPYGGKKVRDYYANITVESRANSQPFELYAVTVDVDESKLHM